MLLHNLYLALVAVLKTASRFDHSEKIYGVNVGSWLIIEPWMMPEEWIKMGGEICDPNKCWTCISSESALVESSPHTADAKFAEHWATWFTKADVDRFVDLGINAVRIPIGYWIIDALVDRTTEFYPRGGMKYLVQGLGWLKDAGIRVVLDHHGLPGAASINQVFTGRCTSEPNFYNPYNYHRALVWTATMTALSHLHPNFETVFAIEAANEPVPDANLTPGYGDFQVAFVQTVRLMELLLGVYSVEECVARFGRNAADLRRVVADLQGAVYGHASLNLTTTLSAFAVGDDGNLLSSEATAAVAEALPIILDVALGLGLHDLKSWSAYKGRSAPLTTNFMDMTWQYYGTPANPADAAMGPQTYDNHLYLCFGDAKTADPVTYINDICNLPRVDAAWDNRNAPLWFGEWSLGTQFNATPEFMRDFADAQKLQFTTGGGWFFWNFKIEESEAAKERVNQWSYYKGVELGWLTKDPSHINNPDVCEKYKNLASQAPKHRIHL